MIIYRKVVDSNEKLFDIEINIDEKSIKIETILNNKRETFIGDNYFSCLSQLRESLENRGLLILCNGARIDVFPSRMTIQMSNGIKAYIHELRKQASDKDLVNVFDSAPADKVGTIEEQRKFYKKWIESLG